MLRTRVLRRIVPMALVVGFAILVPIRAHAAVGGFESAWERLVNFFGGRVVSGLFANNGTEMDPYGRPTPNGAATGGRGGLFGNAGIDMDPIGKSAPSDVTGGARHLPGAGTE